MRVLHYASAVLVLLSCQAIPAQAEDEREHPKIGLALSGGGARGGAHVGVLEVLEELNVPVDYIAGTSMGAIVGGFYAAGFSVEEIKDMLRDTDWNNAFTDQPHRRDQTMRKKDLDSEFLIPYRIGFNKGEFQLPLGAIGGQHLDQLFHWLLRPVLHVRDFDQLPIPFRAVATNLSTGEEVVLRRGSLPDALRASMSVPAVFAPVELEGQLLVDGGMSNNLPVSVVRDMGADIVIAVDISSPLLTEEELNSVLNVSMQLTNFLTRKNTEVQLASLKPDDILLVPDLQGFSSANFKLALEIVEIGRETALANRSELAVLAGPAGLEPRVSVLSKHREDLEYVVQYIDINNSSVLDDEIIRSRLEIELGEAVDFNTLERNIDMIYSLDVFGSVTYDLVRNHEGEDGIRINAAERTWGPNYLQFGLEFADDFSGNSSFKLGAAYTRNALNSLGGELRIVGAFGREGLLEIDFYQPIDRAAHWFIEPRIFYRRQQYNVFIDDSKIAELGINGTGASMAIGRNLSSTDLIALDYQYFRGDADVITGDPGFPLDDDVKIGELVLEYRHDSMDSQWFPTSGLSHMLAYRYADESLGAAFDYDQAFAWGSLPFSFGKNTFLMHYEAGYSFDDAAPVERWFELGGFGRLSGLAPDQLSGRHLGFFNLSYYRRLNDIDLFPAYAGFSLEAGNVWNFRDDISVSDMRTAGSLFIGAETFLGPVYLAWGYSESGDSTVYFFVGDPLRFQAF
jgi:NTE family protein